LLYANEYYKKIIDNLTQFFLSVTSLAFCPAKLSTPRLKRYVTSSNRLTVFTNAGSLDILDFSKKEMMYSLIKGLFSNPKIIVNCKQQGY
jgi:hypothetical protein